jgi:hypothetical protein
VFAERTGLVSLLSVGTVVLNAAGIYVGAMCGGGSGVALGILAAGILSGGAALAIATRYAPIHYPLPQTIPIFAFLPLAAVVVAQVRISGWSLIGALVAKTIVLSLFVGLGLQANMLAFLRHRPFTSTLPNQDV